MMRVIVDPVSGETAVLHASIGGRCPALAKWSRPCAPQPSSPPDVAVVHSGGEEEDASDPGRPHGRYGTRTRSSQGVTPAQIVRPVVEPVDPMACAHRFELLA